MSIAALRAKVARLEQEHHDSIRCAQTRRSSYYWEQLTSEQQAVVAAWADAGDAILAELQEARRVLEQARAELGARLAQRDAASKTYWDAYWAAHRDDPDYQMFRRDDAPLLPGPRLDHPVR